MSIFFKKNPAWRLSAVGFLSLIFTLAFFSQSSSGASYCSPGVDANRCNTKVNGLIQTCANDCDADTEYEWCNATDCAASGRTCENGACRGVSNCVDTDNDGYGATGSTGCPKSGDCNNNNRDVHPEATETCGNGIDEDCSGDDRIENWSCGDWLACSPEGSQTRTCTDGNNCGTTVSKPPVSQICGATIVNVINPTQGSSFILNDRITFRVSITPNTLDNVSLYRRVGGGPSILAATLYDDGDHDDLYDNDGTWGNFITFGSIGTITFELRIGGVPYPLSPSITVTNPSACINVVNSGDYRTTLDVVYIGDNYAVGDLAAFAATVNTFSTAFLNTEPFYSQRTKINIHRIDNTVDLRCYGNYNGIDRLIGCDDLNFVRGIASACPYDEIIVLLNSNVYGGGGYRGEHFATSYKGDPGVAIHEFGHSFASLRDEYTSKAGNGTTGDNDDPNCDDTAGCAKWNSIPEKQCILGNIPGDPQSGGCTYDNWYRSIANGIMRVIEGNTGFGAVNINVINNIFNSPPYN